MESIFLREAESFLEEPYYLEIFSEKGNSESNFEPPAKAKKQITP